MCVRDVKEMSTTVQIPFPRPSLLTHDKALLTRRSSKTPRGVPRQVGTTTKGKVYRLVRPLIGDGLLASAGEEHARQRRTSELGFKLEALEVTK